MAVDNAANFRLHASAKRALGDQEGDTLMERLPPKWEDFATKQDVLLAKQELLTALHFEIRSAITSQTRSFIFANVGLFLSLAIAFNR